MAGRQPGIIKRVKVSHADHVTPLDPPLRSVSSSSQLSGNIGHSGQVNKRLVQRTNVELVTSVLWT